MYLRVLAKKDALQRLFLCLLLLSLPGFSAGAAPDSACAAEHFNATARVRYVYDGDTIRLEDGRKVRLIGINAPELAHNNKPEEAFASEAKKALSDLLHNDKTIRLITGVEEKDHYGRLLAHVFLADGENIQAQLLKQGLARAITIPPNSRLADCYFRQERLARCNKSGLWQQGVTVDAKALEKTDTGFQLVKGRVRSIKINSKGIWLDIDNTLTVGIRPDNRQLFDIDKLNALLDQQIVVRGWLNKSSRSRPFYLRVRHPSSITLYRAFACTAPPPP